MAVVFSLMFICLDDKNIGFLLQYLIIGTVVTRFYVGKTALLNIQN